jgi:hypothetical protein
MRRRLDQPEEAPPLEEEDEKLGTGDPTYE